MATQRQLAMARLRVMRVTTGADLALGWGSEPEERTYDPRWITLADVAVAQIPGESLLATLSGEALLDIHERWLASGEMMSQPAVAPDDISPSRSYNVTMSLDLCWRLAAREQALPRVRVGPEWKQEALWHEVFGL